ncbi:hypothetical protein KKHLCK_16235 [Candidatus Electrothrix laxa]
MHLIIMYCTTVRKFIINHQLGYIAMREITANKFRATLKSCADQSITNHEPLRVTRKRGKDFVIIGAEDWEQIQETLYVLQNISLTQQIQQSFKTHRTGKGYSPSKEQLDEINNI